MKKESSTLYLRSKGYAAPSTKELAAELKETKSRVDADADADVRLNCQSSGWSAKFGNSDFDQDHGGVWGCGCISGKSNCVEVARRLLDDAAEHASQQ